MTDIEWGAEIAVDGKRPEWLRDETGDLQVWSVSIDGYEDRNKLSHLSGDDGSENWFSPEAGCNMVRAIKLPATHDYYKATSRGFTYWPGGESAPADWDGGEVLDVYRNVQKSSWIGRWSRKGEGYYDIIGYRKRTEQPAPAIAPELFERMVTLVKNLAEHTIYQDITSKRVEARAILAELDPDPDLTLAKSIVGDAEAIALAIKAARENAK